MRLLIRHPSMGRLSPSPAFFAESLSVCAEASKNILAVMNRFRDFRQLECHTHVPPLQHSHLVRGNYNPGHIDHPIQSVGKEE